MGDRAVALRIGVVVAGLALAASTLGPAVGSAAPAEPTDSMATGTTTTGTTTTATARTTAPRGRTLKIKITPPPSRKARVEVRGPQGFRKVLGKSTTLKRLTPGRYRITATQVSTRAWVAKPTFSKRAVRVTSRKGAEVTVGYLAVSTKVEVVKPATVKAFEPPVDGSGTLTTTADLQPGEIAAAGVGAETPQGMLVRVQDVRRSGTTSTYVVRQARLDEAIVQGEFETTITADLGVEARRARTHGRGSAAPKPLCTYGTDGADIDPTGGIDMKLTGLGQRLPVADGLGHAVRPGAGEGLSRGKAVVRQGVDLPRPPDRADHGDDRAGPTGVQSPAEDRRRGQARRRRSR